MLCHGDYVTYQIAKDKSLYNAVVPLNRNRRRILDVVGINSPRILCNRADAIDDNGVAIATSMYRQDTPRL